MRHALVVGLGISGKSAAEFLLSYGVRVHGVDRYARAMSSDSAIQQLMQRGLTIQSDSDLKELDSYDLIVVSPGVPPTHPLLLQAAHKGIEVCGEIELGCRFAKNRIVGITGTNGKTTVTLLITHVLNKTGKRARAVGNVGTPLTRELLTAPPDEILVLELSSYQLETLNQRVLDAGAILNITPDHLERYGSMTAYAAAKFKIGDCLKSGAPLYLEHKSAEAFPFAHPSIPIKRYGYASDIELFCDLTAIFEGDKRLFELPKPLQGRQSHDVENLMAAYGICMELDVDANAFVEAIKSFKKPSHRIEFIRSVDGVSYYDDSKGTNIDAVIRAVESLPGEIILIAGGVDKGSPYTPWTQCFTKKVKLICAIGQSADKIHEQISPTIPVEIYSSLEAAVQAAKNAASPGDNVLLSPGCSSFDMFRDYAHRGEVFQRAVMDL